jgi:hypothetical protein
MARGGKRTGAGRKKGQVSQETQLRKQIAEQALKEGLTPLDYMLKILRDETQDQSARFQAAKEAAPYLHPRLASVDHSGELNITKHDDAMNEIETLLGVTTETANGLPH